MGGALYSSTGTVTINNNLGTVAFLSNYVSSSHATGARGGAIYLNSTGTLTISGNENVIFRNNYEKNLQTDGSYSYRLRSIYSSGANLRMAAPKGASITIYDSITLINKDRDITVTIGKGSLGDVVFSGAKTKEDLKALNPTKIWSDAEINENRTSEVAGWTEVEGGRLVICDEAIYKSDTLLTIQQTSAAVMLKRGTMIIANRATFGETTSLVSYGSGNKLVAPKLTMNKNSSLSFNLTRDQLNVSSLMVESDVTSSILTVNVVAGAGVRLETGQYQLLTITGKWTGWDAAKITLTGLSANIADIYWGGANNNILFFNYIAPAEELIQTPEGVGSIDSNSLWTATRSLWSFVGTMRQQSGYVVAPDRKTAFWMTAVGDYFSQEAMTTAPGYNFSSTGYAVGVDYALMQSWKIGVGMSQSFGKQNVSNSWGRVEQDALMAALKVEKSFELNKSYSIEVSLVGAYGGTENTASVTTPLLQGDVLRSNWDDKAWLLDLQSSLTYKISDKTLLDFYTGIQYTDAEQSRHLSSSEYFSYNMSKGAFSSLRLPVGVGLRRFDVLMGHEVMGYIRMGVIQDLKREDPSVTVADSNQSWLARGSKPSKTSYTGSAGAQLKLSAAWSLGMDYSIEAESQSVNQTGRVSAMYQF